MLRICAVMVLVGSLAVLITWRNLAHERLTLDVGLQRSRMETLDKELRHLAGQIEAESAYPRIAKWAREKRGWRALPDHDGVIVLQADQLTAAARQEAKALRKDGDE